MAIAMRSLDATPYFAGYPFQGNYFSLYFHPSKFVNSSQQSTTCFICRGVLDPWSLWLIDRQPFFPSLINQMYYEKKTHLLRTKGIVTYYRLLAWTVGGNFAFFLVIWEKIQWIGNLINWCLMWEIIIKKYRDHSWKNIWHICDDRSM